MKRKTSVYTVIGISIVLFLLGIIGWIAINGRSLNVFFKESIEFDVIVHDKTRDEKIQELYKIIQTQPFARDAKILTKEDALKKYTAEKGEDPTELLGFNPLYTSIAVKLHSEYVNVDSVEKIKKFFLQSNVVREVYYQDVIVQQFSSGNMQKVGIALGIIAAILFIAVVVLIDNTVKLSMFSNRMLIKTMQMVGATRWFIAKPFDMQAILTGALSGLLAVLGILGVWYFTTNQIPDMNALHNPVLFAILLIGIFILGILIALLSTHRSVMKYLKLKLDDLY